MRHRRRLAATVLGALLAAAALAQAEDHILLVGSAMDGSCEYNSLALALLDAALNGPSYDQIRLAKNLTYANVGLVISNMNLEIIGGYENCSDTTIAGTTTVDGAGVPADSVFVVSGTSGTHTVTFNHLTIRNGDARTAGKDGGGLRITGSNVVSLVATLMEDNDGTNGGAIAIDGTSGAVLVADGASVIQQNNAETVTSLGKGGGIYCINGASVGIAGDILENIASLGGGAYLDDCSFTYSATGLGLRRNAAAENGRPSAGLGGGLYMTNGAGALLVGAENRVKLNANGATSGGAIFAIGSTTTITATNVSFRDNVAVEYGAGVYLDAGAQLEVGCDEPAPKPCSLFEGNELETTSAQVVPGGGSLFLDLGAQAHIAQTRFTDERVVSGAMISGEGAVAIVEDLSVLELESCLFDHNLAFSLFQAMGGGRVDVRFSTAVANSVGAVAAVPTSSDRVDFLSSIVWEPGKPVYDPFSALATSVADCLIVADASTLPSGTYAPGVSTQDPRFVDPGAEDYHLQPTSPAIDFCDGTYAIPTAADYDGEARGVEQPTIIDRLGPYDIGFDELAGIILFADGFESGNISAWSAP